MRLLNFRTIAAWSALACTATAHAGLTYEARVGGGASDNITRVATDEVDETMAVVGLDLDWQEQTRRIDARVLTNLSYVDYLQNTYEGDFVGTGDADLTFGIVPDRFLWHVEDNFGQGRGDPFQPVSPANRENINYFTTGPDLQLHFGSQTSMLIFGRYSLSDYELTPSDGERTAAGLGLYRQLSAASRIGLNAMRDESKFDNPLSPEYDRTSAYVSYDVTQGRTRIAAQLGYTDLEFDNGASDSGPLIDVRITRDVSASSTLSVSASQKFTDAAEALQDITSGQQDPGGGLTATSIPYEGRDFGVDWHFARQRTDITLGALFEKDDYVTGTQMDLERQTYTAIFTRRLRPTFGVTLDVRYFTEDFPNANLDADNLGAALRLNWQVGRAIGLRLDVEYYDRDTEDPAGGYQENRAMLYVTWSGGTPGGAGAR